MAATQFTESQRQAIEHLNGPLLILAGPGSGKTRVVTHRIARMVQSGINPWNILAITFTNKAANEMAERVSALMPGHRVWISTFHRFCARLLRSRGEAVGLQPNFSILDTSDQRQLIRQILHDQDIDSVHFPPNRIAAKISNAKNEMRTAETVAASFSDAIGNHMDAVVARVYPEYQKRLLQSNAVDFDDLLLHVVTLLSENEELRRQLGERYQFVMVDEYQDTNLAQYQIVSALSEQHRNLCVTGDPDQSIYGWRGARIDNILRFESDFPNAHVVRLEQNFRSSGRILRAADQLIANNTQRKAKTLVTDKSEGEPVTLLLFDDGRQEADFISCSIRDAVESGQRQYSDFAIFYRVNALSRELERALMRHRVPYQVAAGMSFYDRAEIKDVLAYLRLMNNPQDETAFRRIVNSPKRGIGKTTVSRVSLWAAEQGCSLLEASSRADEIPTLSTRAKKLVKNFAELMDNLSHIAGETVEETLRIVIEKSGYIRLWENSPLEQDQQRLANVEELVTAARQHDQTFGEDSSVESFLETTSLVNEVDNLDDSAGRVTLMTLHAAKGLEFPVVYLLAVEQNLIPHERSLRSGELRELEEERRLLFVGMTRAMQELYLTETRQREFRGRPLHTIRSDFLDEMDLDERDESTGSFAGNWTWNGSWQQEVDDDDEQEPTSDEFPKSPAHNDTPSIKNEQSKEKKTSTRKPLIMTGADLLNQKSDESSVNSAGGFDVGMTVRHPRYGLGTIIQTGGYSRAKTVTVFFEQDNRQETFVVNKAPLQPVGL
ncbi:MAG: UvrD-helicase domain-containing protein [Planctomycetaceae bacterium]